MNNQEFNNVDSFLSMYNRVWMFGSVSKPRNEEIRELSNCSIYLKLNQSPCTNFLARKFNLQYAKQELLWYLKADKFDDSIQSYATMWKKLKQPDGSYYSNYGQYIWFSEFDNSPWDYVINQLIQDKDSRRAVIMLLQPKHLFLDNVDTVCTYAIHFRIQANYLNMTVMMRSNDVIWGFSNDCFCFWWMAQMMYVTLKEYYPELKLGIYEHFTNSLHVYSRHYDMIKNIIREGPLAFTDIPMPQITVEQVEDSILHKNPDNPFIQWLRS